jgi:DNA-binding CsgD family transcriptional regulator
MGTIEARILGCLEEILDAPPGEPLGPLLTRSISSTLPADTCVFTPAEGAPPTKRGGPNWSLEAFQRRRQQYVAEMPGAEHFRRLGRAISTHQEIYEARAWDRLTFVDEILRPQRIGSQLVATVSEGQRRIGTLYLGRRGTIGGFRSRDLEHGIRLLRCIGSALCERRTHEALVPLAGLTTRESEVAQQVALGKTNGEIAVALRISTHTIANHLRHIYEKLGLTNRSQLAVQLASRGI